MALLNPYNLPFVPSEVEGRGKPRASFWGLPLDFARDERMFWGGALVFPGRRVPSMPEVAHPREYHRQPGLVRRRDHVRVAD